MGVDPEDAARDDMTTEIEGQFLRRLLGGQAKVWIEFAEDADDHALVECLRDLSNLCDNDGAG